jgi:4,5-dihydroxyphthalate decarboxylase
MNGVNEHKDDVIRIGCRQHDWTQALFDQRLGSPFHLNFVNMANAGLNNVIGASPTLDFGECGLTQIIWARCRGVPVKALPVFVRCSFRHSYIFVRTDARIKEPRDLEGKRVGTTYGMTANVWARGLLQHEYGVCLERIHWLNQDSADWLNQKGPEGSYTLPPGLVLEPVARDVNLQEWLLEGKIDALIHPDLVPSNFLARGGIRRLFPMAAQEERNYYLRTRIVPVMNAIVFRADEMDIRPDVVQEVFKAFCRAKELGLEAMQDNRRSGLLWYWESLETQLDVVGYDPLPYSVEKSRNTLEALVTYSAEQGLIDRRIALEDIFPPDPD